MAPVTFQQHDDGQVMGVGGKDDFDDEPPGNFTRAVRISTNPPRNRSFSRLSAVIRRSLRLPSRPSFGDTTDHVRKEEELATKEKQRFLLEDAATLNSERFSANCEILVMECSQPARLDEIRENRRLNRIEKVKKIVRAGDWSFRHAVRRELWKELLHSKDFDSGRVLYESTLEELQRNGSRMNHPAFLNEEGVVINNYQLNEHGTIKLLRLLKVVEILRPEIKFAPTLYPVCALMLHYFEEADTFSMIQKLVISKTHLMTSMLEWVASSHTLLALIKKHKTAAYHLLRKRIGPDDRIIVTSMRDWLSWVFQQLPLQFIVRVLDCFIVEGHKFIVRAGMAIVYVWAKKYKSAAMGDEAVPVVVAELIDTCKNMSALVSPDTFIEVCCRIRNLQGSNISRFQKQFEEQFRSEVRIQESQRRPSVADKNPSMKPFSSTIVEAETALAIMGSLPPRFQLNRPELIFRLSNDGASFTKMWQCIDEADQTLLIIRTTTGEIFGAYCSSSWAERNDRRERSKSKYFGTGESFVWKLCQETGITIFYHWVGKNNNGDFPQMFQAARDKMILIGSGNGDAIRIDEELTQGMTGESRTFASPPLVDEGVFDIHEMEWFEVPSGV